MLRHTGTMISDHGMNTTLQVPPKVSTNTTMYWLYVMINDLHCWKTPDESTKKHYRVLTPNCI